jgi:hypothetical protein
MQMSEQSCQPNVIPAEIKPVEKLTVGRIVNIVMTDGKHRPGICVATWGNNCGNFQVFVDGTNDGYWGQQGPSPNCLWLTSICNDEANKYPRTWHWPERD